MSGKPKTRAGAMKTPPVRLPPAPPAPDSIRCRHTDAAGERCPVPALKNGFCVRHLQTVGDEVTMKENNAVGGAETADQMRAELEALRAQNAVLQAKTARLETETAPAAGPFADPENEGSRLAAQMAGVDPDGARGAAPGRTPAPRPAQDIPAEAAGHLELVALLKDHQERALQDRDRRRKDRRRRGLSEDEGRVPIELYETMPAQLDPAAMVDEFGNSLVPPGWVGRWIRTYEMDANGGRHGSNYRERVFKIQWGAKDVMKPIYDANGKKAGEEPLVDMCGKAVMYPIDRYARRVLHHSPHGAFDAALDHERDILSNFAEEENSRAGIRGGITQLVVPDQHGDRGSGL